MRQGPSLEVKAEEGRVHCYRKKGVAGNAERVLKAGLQTVRTEWMGSWQVVCCMCCCSRRKTSPLMIADCLLLLVVQRVLDLIQKEAVVKEHRKKARHRIGDSPDVVKLEKMRKKYYHGDGNN